ncbi:hypothetical protein BAE44_0013846 [Dichanthelium oligosanthes]|uniref:Serpin domain-containing protein n=1 Tax=Dichanthelium oligosanthes TaxID=888268 RepID=A0A1E5VJ50_9POAL|nr:hypothetical protein BAE44_0013846 [Dichanthelium oligosanthes]
MLAFLGAPSAAALAALGRRVSQRVLGDGRGYYSLGGPRVIFGGGVWVDVSRGGITDAFRGVASPSRPSWCEPYLLKDDWGGMLVKLGSNVVPWLCWENSAPEAAVKTINESVKKAMDSLIDGIIYDRDVGAAADIVLANAVCFKAFWPHSFHPRGTWPGTFHRLDSGHAEASFMTSLGTMHVACLDGFKVLKLPYKSWELVMFEESRCYQTCYSMLVFLPDAYDGIAAMVDVVTMGPASLRGILTQMMEGTVRVKLPKFEISFNWDDLEGDLRRLGLSLPFSPEEADLRGMCLGDDVQDVPEQGCTHGGH